MAGWKNKISMSGRWVTSRWVRKGVLCQGRYEIQIICAICKPSHLNVTILSYFIPI